VLRASPLCTCCRHYPGTATGALHCSIIQSFQPSPKWLSGRPVQRPFRGLLSVHSRYGLHTRAVTEFCDTLHRRLQPFRCLHSCSGCFRLERLPGGTFTHWDNAAFSRRTPITDIIKIYFSHLKVLELTVGLNINKRPWPTMALHFECLEVHFIQFSLSTEFSIKLANIIKG